MKNIMLVGILGLLVSGCAGEKSDKVTPLQKRDKQLSCKEIKLEMNEAEFYRQTAEKNKGPKVKSLVMPLGYISTYMDAEEAIDASDARIDYLNRIYDILECDNPQSSANRTMPAWPQLSEAPPQPQAYMARPAGYYYPVNPAMLY